MNNIPDCKNGSYDLTKDRRCSSTHHSPFKYKDTDRVQNNVEHGTGKRGCHCKLRTAVCSDDGVHSLSEHIKGDSERNVEEVFL